ncbi:GGDEF domain-containing protein [Pseudoalteromonas sp. T1lg65]|uniref:GGDEF domain-containing protein n=1 Tax=Pseudoalteromonas sp. T1lg65 TaxID=2077101 RepID=UPI003F7A8390
MMFHDSMSIAQEKMTQVCLFLEQHQLPPTPMNYQVAYTHVSKVNKDLDNAIERFINSKQKIDCIFMEQLYYQFLDKGQQLQTDIIDGVDSVMNKLDESTQRSQQHIAQFANQVSHCVHSLDANNVEKSRRALNALTKHTETLLRQHKQYKVDLLQVQQLQEKNQRLLKLLRKEHLLDPQTGLYKRHYLSKKVELWQSQQKSVCALSIQVENLDEFISKFGDVVGEIVLNRVANNIKRYVTESGFPGRTGKQEFTVLLADVDLDTAEMIAEKVRKGVEKLKFVSAKGKLPLPQVTISQGIAKMHESQGFDTLAKRAGSAAQKALSMGTSCYIGH